MPIAYLGFYMNEFIGAVSKEACSPFLVGYEPCRRMHCIPGGNPAALIVISNFPCPILHVYPENPGGRAHFRQANTTESESLGWQPIREISWDRPKNTQPIP
jgi:hypothetical protein